MLDERFQAREPGSSPGPHEAPARNHLSLDFNSSGMYQVRSLQPVDDRLDPPLTVHVLYDWPSRKLSLRQILQEPGKTDLPLVLLIAQYTVPSPQGGYRSLGQDPGNSLGYPYQSRDENGQEQIIPQPVGEIIPLQVTLQESQKNS
jgi:hypothetical protein